MTATSTATAGRTDIAATIALGSGSLVDANKDGMPVTATLGGAGASGTIYLAIRYVVD